MNLLKIFTEEQLNILPDGNCNCGILFQPALIIIIAFPAHLHQHDGHFTVLEREQRRVFHMSLN